MKALSRSMGVVILLALVAQGAAGGTISGTVKDPSGAPFRGAFVRARNEKTKITVSVLSNNQGRYVVADLPAGDYEVRATATGFRSDPHGGVKVAAADSASVDFALQKGVVRWSDLSVYQGKKLLPESKGKDVWFSRCFACHGFQTRMAATRRDEAGWTRAVNYMREVMHPRLAGLKDEEWTTITSYLNSTFGVDSDLPRSPADLPAYRETVRPISDEGLKIVYVEYEMPGPNRHPFSAAPDKDGNLWIPDFGRANKIAKLNPNTGEIQEFTTPHQGTAGIHSAFPGPDGTVWFAQQASNKLGKWDPATGKITEYQDAYRPGAEGLERGGSKHTSRVAPNGIVWSSGSPLTSFDPKTEKFTRYEDVAGAYDVTIDKEGSAWFTQTRPDYKIGKVDAKTGKMTKWETPTANSFPRRIAVDSQGIVWAGEFNAGKIARFDPKTETFREFQLPGPRPTPYALGIDKNDNIWYSSDEMDVMGRLDPKTGQVTEYPFPYSENYLKEFIMDSQGRMWFGTPPNNKVGYLVLPTGSASR